jgi:hypothetical protein
MCDCAWLQLAAGNTVMMRLAIERNYIVSGQPSCYNPTMQKTALWPTLHLPEPAIFIVRRKPCEHRDDGADEHLAVVCVSTADVIT